MHSVFPGWRFTGRDTTAAQALHGGLFLGPWVEIDHSRDGDGDGDGEGPSERKGWTNQLRDCTIDLYRDGELVDSGVGSNVLDNGPLAALGHLVALLAAAAGGDGCGKNEPLEAGEIVTTGTVTRAWPVRRGERWETRVRGIGLEGARIRFT